MNSMQCPMCDKPINEHTQEEVNVCIADSKVGSYPLSLSGAISFAYAQLGLLGTTQTLGTGEWHLTFVDGSIDTKDPFLTISQRALAYSKPAKRKLSRKEVLQEASQISEKPAEEE